MALDASKNYLAWPNPEAVSLTFKRSAGNVLLEVAIAKRGSLTKDDQNFAGIDLSTGGATWSLPVALLDGNEPASGDRIEDSAGVGWLIQRAELLGWGSRWRVACTKER